MRNILERRRLCRYRTARHAQIGLHRRRPLRHRQCVDRLACDVHEPDAGRRAARLRHAAARVRPREPHRHDGAGAEDRSGRIPPQERAAQRPPAGNRHDPQRCAARGDPRPRRRPAALAGKIRSRQRHAQARPRPRIRAQGLRLADHLGRYHQCRRRRQPNALHFDGRHGARLRHRHGADRRRGAQHAGRTGQGRCPRHRHNALRHGHARLALAIPHGPCGAARRRGCAQQDRRVAARSRRTGRQQHAGRPVCSSKNTA